LGDYRQEVELRLRQVEITRQQNDKFSEASALIVLASIYNDNGEHQKAAETYQQALAVARQIEIAKLPNFTR
jgi:Tfp pilus assembly protein PilF